MKSMTGFAREKKLIKGWRITVEVRTLNHRFLDIFIKLPNQLLELDPEIRNLISKYINRGKVETFVRLEADVEVAKKPALNRELVRNYLDELKKFAKQENIKPEIDIATLILLPQIFEIKEGEPGEIVKSEVISAVNSALMKATSARKKEGAALKQEILKRLRIVDSLAKKILKLEPKAKAEAKKSFYERIQALKLEEVDQTRLAQEVAILLQKLDFTEEIVRLDGHLKRIRETCQETKPVGRNIDFILQECHRETTTLLNKAQNLEISGMALEIKAELEKMREQVQNIE